MAVLKITEMCLAKKNSEEPEWKLREVVTLIVKTVVTAGYSYLATRHLYLLSEWNSFNYFGLSVVTLTTSMYSLHSSQVK